MIKYINNLRTNQALLYDITYALVTAFLFSFFIYAEHYLTTFKILNTIFAIASLALLLYASKRSILIAGYAIGILWFYWIGYSFEYQGVGFMTPVIIVGFGFIYLLFFGTLALTHKIYIRAILLFGLSFVEPFNWNWMQIELLFVESYIGVFKYQLALVITAITLPYYLKKPLHYLPLLLLPLAYNYNPLAQVQSSLKIKLVQTNIKQEDKWLDSHLRPTLLIIRNEINTAIAEGYDIVVLPESVFPLFLNRNKILLEKVLEYSHDIVVIAGSLTYEDSKSYNVTYIMQDGEYTLAKKMILVPFGEYIPLPKFAQDYINDTFFAGQSDFVTADKPTDFTIKGETFRNAICYEATCQELYEGDVKLIIATSNNAWFEPSIEPTLQNLLMRYYARKNGVTIYHSANYKGTGIIQ